jgi:transposase
VWKLLAAESASLLRTAMEEARTGPVRRLLTFTDGERFAFTLSCSVHRAGETFRLFGEQRIEQERRMNEELLALTDELALVSRERARLAAELEKTLADLRESHWLIRKIHEHLPVCVICHKVAAAPRDEARWEPLATFLADNGLFMTHGYCPGCESAALAALEGTVLPEPPAPSR